MREGISLSFLLTEQRIEVFPRGLVADRLEPGDVVHATRCHIEVVSGPLQESGDLILAHNHTVA